MMQYKDFRGEVSLSRLGMGTMRLPREGNQPGAPIDFAKSETIIDKAMASGINYDVYKRQLPVMMTSGRSARRQVWYFRIPTTRS